MILKEAVQSQGVTFLGSNDYYDIYKITELAGLRNFYDDNSAQCGGEDDPWGFSQSNWTTYVVNQHYEIYIATRHESNIIEVMFLDTQGNNNSTITIDINDNYELSYETNLSYENGRSHSSDYQFDTNFPFYILYQNHAIEYLNSHIEKNGVVLTSEGAIFDSYCPQLIMAKENYPENIIFSYEFDVEDPDMQTSLNTFVAYGVKNIALTHEQLADNFRYINDEVEDLREDSNLENLHLLVTKQDFDEIIIPLLDEYYDDPEDSNKAFLLKFIVSISEGDSIEDVIKHQAEAEAKRQAELIQKAKDEERRKLSKVIFKEVGDEIHIVGSKKTGELECLVIPRTYNDKPVTVIEQAAFAYNNSIKSIVLPNTLKRIEADAFYNSEIRLICPQFDNNTLRQITLGNLDAINPFGRLNKRIIKATWQKVGSLANTPLNFYKFLAVFERSAADRDSLYRHIFGEYKKDLFPNREYTNYQTK